MSSIVYKNFQVFLTDGHNNKTAILNVYTPLSNCSSLPMYESEGGAKFPIFDLLTSIRNDFDQVNRGVTSGLEKTEVDLSLILTLKALLKKHRDFTLLEIGCGNGVLSCCLARLLKPFNRNNRLICVADDMNMDHVQCWRDKVSLSGAEDIVSLVTSKYERLLFPKSIFDVVVINGSVQFEEPGKIIYSAVKFLRTGGMLISVPASQYLLSSSFQVIMEDCAEYYLSSTSSVFVKTITQKDKYLCYKRSDEFKVDALKQSVVRTLASLKKTIEKLDNAGFLAGNNDSVIDEEIKMIMRAENDVLKIYSRLGSAELKFNINELKESLINYRLSTVESERKHYAGVCVQKYQTVILEMRAYSDFAI